MKPEEIRQLQVGNLIMVGDMIAVVDRVTMLTPGMCQDVDRPVIMYEGHYQDFERMADGGIGWVTTDCPEFNERMRPTPLEDFHGIPIPENFEKLNGVNLWNDPKAVEAYQFVHLYQNEWNHYEGFKFDWRLK